jgi:hypothetical protein
MYISVWINAKISMHLQIMTELVFDNYNYNSVYNFWHLNILAVCYDRIISLRGGLTPHTTNVTPPLFIEVYVM